MIDGAAWLKQLETQPATLVLLAHDDAVALARSLASAQAMQSADRQIAGVCGRLAAGIAGVSGAA